MHHYPLFVRRRSAEQLRCCVSAQLMLLIAMAWMLIVAVAWMLIVHRQDAQTEGELADHGTVDDCLFYKKRDPKDGINIAADGTCASFNPRTGFPNLVEGLSTVAWTAVEMSMDDSEVVAGDGLALLDATSHLTARGKMMHVVILQSTFILACFSQL